MQKEAAQSILTETSMWHVCILVGITGAIALVAVFLFGLLMYRGRLRRNREFPDDLFFHAFENWLHGPPRPQLRPLLDAFSEHLERRNEFWTGYGQVLVATLIIIVLAILLLTKSISAEAGLPVLSGISGFAIAKTVSVGRGSSQGPDDKQA